jgi:hypothetical protein
MSLSKRVTEIVLVRYAIVHKVESIDCNGSILNLVSSKMDLVSAGVNTLPRKAIK